MNRFPLVLLAATLLFVSGCARAPQPALEAPPGAAIDTASVLEPLVRALVSRTTAVRTLRGRAEIAVSSEGWEGSSQSEAVVVAERPDRLHLRAYAGPVTAFDLLCDGGRFWADVRDRRELWTGPVQALEHRMGIPALGEKLVLALLGDPFGEPKDARLVSMTADRAVVEWSARGGGVAQAKIRRLDGAPLGMTWIKDGKTLATVRYDDFVHETDQGLWPRKLSFHWSQPEASLRLQFHEIALNRDLPEISFAPPDPAGAKRIDFGGADSSGEGER